MSDCPVTEAGAPAAWWRDKDLLDADVRFHGSRQGAARAHGAAFSTVKDAWHRHGLPPMEQPAPTPRDPAQTKEEVDEQEVLKAVNKLGEHASIEEIADLCDTSPRRVRVALESLGFKGYRLEPEGDHHVTLHKVPRPSETEHEVLFDGDVYRFGVASDAHLNSRHCRLEELHIAYDRFEAEGIDTVYNPGDIVSGLGIFRGQAHEVINHTFETQVDYAVDNYPVRNGIKTLIISGNHDCEGSFGNAGADACHAVANRREDIDWCGMYAADFVLPQGTVITMRHPMGGSSYAKSYKPQKFAESFEGGTKPGVVLFGHWHNVEWGFHRNIHMLNCGTFEGYGGTLGLRVPLGAPAVGFFIVEMTVADDGSVVRFKPEWFPFYANRRASEGIIQVG